MPTWWSAVPKGSPHSQQCDCRLQGRRWWDLASESKTIQGQDRRKRIAFGGLWKGRLKSISSRFRETPPAGRHTNCEPSAADRSWTRGAASIGARCVLQGNEKTRRKRYAACDELVRPTGFEPESTIYHRLKVAIYNKNHIFFATLYDTLQEQIKPKWVLKWVPAISFQGSLQRPAPYRPPPVPYLQPSHGHRYPRCPYPDCVR